MNNTIKTIARYLAILTISLYISAAIIAVNMYYTESSMFKGTYIAYIFTPTLGEKKVQKALDNFNKLGYNNSVKYRGTRPIYIYEEDLEPGILGRAMVRDKECIIKLDIGVPKELLEDITQHEMVHCFGYMHNDILGSLMYPYLGYEEDYIMEVSKKYYSTEIAKRFYD